MTSIPAAEGKSAPVIVVPYESSWPDKFESERQVLFRVLKPWLAGPIEHVGSTAVPALAAKPVIDIMVAVESLDASRPAIPAAEAAGYIYWPYKANIMHWFCNPSDAHRTHHLHLVPYGSRLWQARLGFRDALRADVRLAQEYAQLKLSLAGKYRDDREAYTQSKTEFVQQVLQSVGLAQASET
ncbi:MAG: GrpB family protein [Candidatus Caldatribacteriota bacterium]